MLKLLSAGSMASLLVMSLGSMFAYAASGLPLTVTINGQTETITLPASGSTPGLHEAELTTTVSGQTVTLPAIEYVVNAAGTSATVVTSTAPAPITVSLPTGAPSGLPTGIEATFTSTVAGGGTYTESIPVSDFNSANGTVTFDPLGTLPLGDYTLSVAFTFPGTPQTVTVVAQTTYTASAEAVPGNIQAVNAGAVSVAANGTVAETFTVTDAVGNPIAGVAVSFGTTGTLATGDLSTATGTTNANGQVTVTYADPTVGDTGSVTATVVANGSLTTQAGPITVVPATPAKVTTSLANGGNITAGQPVSVTFSVWTASGVPVPGATLSLSLTGQLAGTFSNSTPTTNDQGQATVTFTPSEPTSGQTVTGMIQAAVQGYPSVTGETGTLTVVGQSPAGITAQASSTTVAAGGSTTVSFEVTDKAGSPLPNVPVTFTVTDGLSASDLMSTTGVTNQSGMVTATYQNDTQAGVSGAIVATTAGYPAYSAQTLVTVTAGAPNMISVGATTANETVGSVYSAMVEATDQYGNPYTGSLAVEVYGSVFQPSPNGMRAQYGATSNSLAEYEGTMVGVPSGSGTNLVTLNFVNGQATLYFSPADATTAATDTLGVALPGSTVSSAPIDAEVSVTRIMVSDQGATPATVTTSQSSAMALTAGQWDSITFTVRSSDGNVIPDVPVAFHTVPNSNGIDTLNGSTATLNTLTGTTNQSGQVTVEFRDTQAGDTGEIQAVATLGSNSVASGTTGVITVVAGAPTHFTSSLPAGSSASVSATGSESVTFTAWDQYGNPVPNTLVSFAMMGLNGSVMDGSNSYAGLTNANGQLTVTYTPTPITTTGSGQIEVESIANSQAQGYSGYIDFTAPAALPASDVNSMAAPESESANQPGGTAYASALVVDGTTYHVLGADYASQVSEFATVSAGGATVATPQLTTAAEDNGSYGSANAGDTLAVWVDPSGYYYLDVSNEQPGAGSTSGTAYVGFGFTSQSPYDTSIWYVGNNGQLATDNNTTATDYLYTPVAQESAGVWSLAPQETVDTWIKVNGTVYQFNVQQP